MRIAQSVVAATLALGLMSGAAFAQEFTLKIAAASPSNGNVCSGMLDRWGDKVKEESGGRIDYKLFCDGTLTKFGDAVDRVAAGVADLAWEAPAAYGDRFAGINVVGVPGMYTDMEGASGALWNAYDSGKLGTIDEVKVIWFQAAANNTFWLKKKPASHENVEGLKIGLGSKIRSSVVDASGGVPLFLKVPEYYQSVAKGTADGLMTTGGAVEAYSINEVTNYYMHGPFGGGTIFFVMNKDVYNSMPADLQKVIDNNTGYEWSRWTSKYLHDIEENAMQEFLKREGTARYQLTPEEVESWKPAFEKATANYLADTPGGDGYLAAFKEQLEADNVQ